jgi:hypothetical protein
MFPWLWIWAPQLHYPWSGSVAQRIEPDTNWFFDAIPAQAGNGGIEKKAFEVASYGRQLGLITEVLIDLAKADTTLSAEATTSLERLKSIRSEIEKIKVTDTDSLVREIENAFGRLQSSNPSEFARLRQRLGQTLTETVAGPQSLKKLPGPSRAASPD